MSETKTLALLSTLLTLACASAPGAQAPGLSDVRCAELTETLGSIGPLEPLSVEEVRAAVLAARELPVPPAVEVRNADFGAAEAVPPRPSLPVEEHAQRLQLVAAWAAQSPSGAAPWAGTVEVIRNAKTFAIAPEGGGQPRRVALYGVQVPFLEQLGGPEALELVEEVLAACGNRVVVVPVTESGRNLYASVLIPDEDGRVEPLGELLLRHGLAWWNERYAGLDARLRTLHYAVRDARVGTFASDSVVSPRTFDRIRRKLEEGHRFEGQSVTARVVNVSDGDTLAVELSEQAVAALPALREFLDENGADRVVTIRLAGVDTPEIDQPGGVQAWAITALVCGEGDEVTLVLTDEGGYGRVAARVICPDGELLGEKLVRTGRARHYEYYLPDARLASLEDRARYAKIGLWSSPYSIVPGMWRDVHIDVQGLWVFEGDKHWLVVDADCDLTTLEDQERVTSSRYRDEFARERFDRLTSAWVTQLAPAGR